ncbi:MAG: hypothetical protein HY516_03675 [Candidatus Aenigmarchaeota archaeon]|nr:hypothetical protein [Candidatus Aenigmarchaeota archaeon]
MSFARSLGQGVLFSISFLLIIVGLITMSSENNNWMLILIGLVVVLAGHYFKQQLVDAGF